MTPPIKSNPLQDGLERLPATAIYLALAIASSLGIVGKLPLLARLLHVPQPAAAALLLCGFALPFFWRQAVRFRVPAAAIFAVGLIVCSFVLYPRITALHAEGRGSDQADCVIVVAGKIAALQWPYDRAYLWSHNSLNCGPGWVLLQAPVVRFAGYSVDIVAIWAISLWLIARALGRDRTLALMALLALAPGTWLGATNGSDFFTFGIALAALVAWSMQPAKSAAERWIFAIVATLAFQFRPPMLLIPGLLRRSLGRTQALAIGLTGILLQYALLLTHPNQYVNDGPFWTLHKALRRSILPAHPLLLSTLVTVGLILALLLATQLGKKVSPLVGTLGFMLLLLGAMAVSNMDHVVRWGGPTLEVLGLWEGGIWLWTCLPLAAMAICLRQIPAHPGQGGTAR